MALKKKIHKKKSTGNKKLEEKILFTPPNAWEKLKRAPVFAFAEGYKDFLRKYKTEREAAKYLITQLVKHGFQSIDQCPKLSAGQKVFKLFKHRLVLCARIGAQAADYRIIGSHIDSPRLDLKPNPLYEDSSLAMMKSHYYGGIKKYHWLNTPLSMHAVVHTEKGKVEFSIGENEDEPRFIIPDLLPHLGKEQMKKPAGEAVSGEQLNIIAGHIPVNDKKVKKAVKFAVMKTLYEKTGMTEKNFLTADISFTPAQKPIDIGMDRGLIAAYGQDDRICAYSSFQALLDANRPKCTAVCFFADKEEIGSNGDTGAQGTALENFLQEIADGCGLQTRIGAILERARSISADVTSALNPNFPEVHDKRNVSMLGHGVSIEKYGGGGGKYSTNDASSEYMSWLIGLLEKAGVVWQTGENGKIDLGGGGTIAKFMAQLGMDCIDMGPALLAMHSVNEVSSKADLYNAYLAYKAFFESP